MIYTTPEKQDATRPVVHPSQRQHHVTPVSAPLYVITAITNPNRYYSRYKLYQAFEKMVTEAGGILYTVELALRDRHFEITRPGNYQDIQVRSPEILWYKENLLNIAIQRLPADWQYVAWIDADILFTRPDWVVETIHQLQTYKVVQLWSDSVDLGPDFQTIATCQSLMHTYSKNHHILQAIANRKFPETGTNKKPTHVLSTVNDGSNDGSNGKRGNLHTGYAWAARRSAISDLGGLGDIGILGAGDRHMAYALLGYVDHSFPGGVQQSYKDYWRQWQERAETYIQRKVGVVPGTIVHYWHGSKVHRRYQDRWQILVQDKFDYLNDLKRDPQGLWQLTDKNLRLRDDLINYFAVRNEDSIDL